MPCKMLAQCTARRAQGEGTCGAAKGVSGGFDSQRQQQQRHDQLSCSMRPECDGRRCCTGQPGSHEPTQITCKQPQTS